MRVSRCFGAVVGEENIFYPECDESSGTGKPGSEATSHCGRGC